MDGPAAWPVAVDRLTAVVARSRPIATWQRMEFADLPNQSSVGLASGSPHDPLGQTAAQLGRRVAYRVRLRAIKVAVGRPTSCRQLPRS